MNFSKLEETIKYSFKDKALLENAMETFASFPVFPYNILAITFTNKAANEIKSRLESRLGEMASDIWAGTFHSVCAKLLRMHIDALGYEKTFTIYLCNLAVCRMHICQEGLVGRLWRWCGANH